MRRLQQERPPLRRERSAEARRADDALGGGSRLGRQGRDEDRAPEELVDEGAGRHGEHGEEGADAGRPREESLLRSVAPSGDQQCGDGHPDENVDDPGHDGIGAGDEDRAQCHRRLRPLRPRHSAALSDDLQRLSQEGVEDRSRDREDRRGDEQPARTHPEERDAAQHGDAEVDEHDHDASRRQGERGPDEDDEHTPHSHRPPRGGDVAALQVGAGGEHDADPADDGEQGRGVPVDDGRHPFDVAGHAGRRKQVRAEHADDRQEAREVDADHPAELAATTCRIRLGWRRRLLPPRRTVRSGDRVRVRVLWHGAPSFLRRPVGASTTMPVLRPLHVRPPDDRCRPPEGFCARG